MLSQQDEKEMAGDRKAQLLFYSMMAPTELLLECFKAKQPSISPSVIK